MQFISEMPSRIIPTFAVCNIVRTIVNITSMCCKNVKLIYKVETLSNSPDVSQNSEFRYQSTTGRYHRAHILCIEYLPTGRDGKWAQMIIEQLNARSMLYLSLLVSGRMTVRLTWN